MTKSVSTTRSVDRRSFVKKRSTGRKRCYSGRRVISKTTSAQERGRLNPGDAAILRFLAAAELIEADLWTQYAELRGIGKNPPVEIDPNQSMNNYQIALSNLDSDGPQYIASNTWMK
jgi:hypothetical protein